MLRDYDRRLRRTLKPAVVEIKVSSRTMRESPLARILFAVYVALVIYASLYRSRAGATTLVPARLSVAPWSRFVTGFDVTANLLGYVPYGFLCVAALYPRVQGGGCAGIATSAASRVARSRGRAKLSPARVAAGLDVLCNGAGAALGALAGPCLVQQLLEEGPLKRCAPRLTPGVEWMSASR